MSQTGTVLSASPLPFGNDWIVLYTYQLDVGGIQEAEIVVGNGNYFPPVAFWASAQSTITVSPNPPGTSNPVVLSCPPIVQFAAFGLALT